MPRKRSHKPTTSEAKILFSSVGKSIDWKIFKILSEFVEGFDFLRRLHKEVSVFGSARFGENNTHYKEARRLGKMLSDAGFTVITGGGPGIMEAANRGAKEGKTKGSSVGLNIQLPAEQRVNQYVEKSIAFDFFFTRKVMLAASAQAYVFFPGGFGTLDEFFEMVTLIQTKKVDPVKIILVGRDFWKPLLNWIEQVMYFEHKAIEKKDMDIYYVAKDVDDAFRVIKNSKEMKYINR